MKTNNTPALEMELNRTLAMNIAFESPDYGSARLSDSTGRHGKGHRNPAPDISREPRFTCEAPLGDRAKLPVNDDAASVFTLYLREIGQVKLLSREEEAELARRIKAGDETAREEMIKANLRLVVRIARDFEGLGLPLLDLISEGNIGLMQAVDRYDAAKGAKLSVYASFYIKLYMRRALSNHARTIRMPVHVLDRLHTIRTASSQLQETLGRTPTHDEVARKLGMPAAGVQTICEAAQTPISLDEPLDEGEPASVAELVADEDLPCPWDSFDQAVSLEQLREFMEELSPREQTVLKSRFGIDGEPDATLEEVGRRLRLTRERVRQIQTEALAKLRRKFQAHELHMLVA